MHRFPRFLVLVLGLAVLGSIGLAQPGTEPGKALDAFVARLMAFDKNSDGKLAKDELTDDRLQRVFERADANKDDVVTREELVALATQEAALGGQPGGKGGGKGGFGGQFQPGQFPKDKGGFPKDGFGKGGFGKGGFGFGRPAPGQIMPPSLQEQLKLTDDQKAQVEKLQKDIDAKLEKLLTEEQRETLTKMKAGGFGPFGPGGPGGKGGPFGPGEKGGPGGKGGKGEDRP